MSVRIEVASVDLDTRASVKKSWLKNLNLFEKVSLVYVFDVYTIDKDFSQSQLNKIASILANPVNQKSQVITSKILRRRAPQDDKSHFYPKSFAFAMETTFLPGVTDNVGGTAKEEIQDALRVKFSEKESVYSSQLLLFIGRLTQKEAEIIAENLANPLIQRVYIKSFEQFKKDSGMGISVPKVSLDHKPQISEVNLNVNDDELQKIGKQGIPNSDGTKRGPLALNLDYMRAIQNYFNREKRNPTDVELETLAQTWSEHCKHTIFADPIDDTPDGLFRTYIKGATEKINHPLCVSVFKDNSGAIEFDKDYLITHKVETHNTPSALEPFGGALTGIVGVNRDAIGFGLGAKPIANTYGFCFADPKNKIELYRDKEKTQKMLSPRRIMLGVIEGINVGGNCSGIPTPQGFIYFDDSYLGKPLVFCGTIGIIPKKVGNRNSWEKKAQPGDYIVMVGGRVGIDGIHGATFSSEEIHKGSPASAVQIADPITQKKFSDAITKEARDLGLYNSITDNGAGGLSSSAGEISKESGGCLVNLEKVPLKYLGLDPWQIWVSESQERMTLAVPKNKWDKFSDLMKRRGVEATVIGEFTKSGRCIVKYGDKKVLDLDLEFMHDGLPTRQLKTEKPANLEILRSKAQDDFKKTGDLSRVFLEMLKSLNHTSFEFISEQYDHIVQSNNVVTPLQGKGRVNGQASVIKPLLTSNKGLVLSQGLYPEYSELDPYKMAAASIDTAIRNAVAMGANPEKIVLLDNFCWSSSDDPKRLWQLKETCKACFDYSVAFGTPFISGKDSMFNDFSGFDKNGKPIKISVLPTLLISSLGIIENVTDAITIDFKNDSDLIYLLGETKDDVVPSVDAKRNMKLYENYFKAVNEGLIASGIALTRGGLALALAKSALAGKLGIDVKLKTNLKDNVYLFSESQGRILVSMDPKNKFKFEKILGLNNIKMLGAVKDNGKISIEGKKKITVDLENAFGAYKSTLKGY